jgi:hypothetical protein
MHFLLRITEVRPFITVFFSLQFLVQNTPGMLKRNRKGLQLNRHFSKAYANVNVLAQNKRRKNKWAALDVSKDIGLDVNTKQLRKSLYVLIWSS